MAKAGGRIAAQSKVSRPVDFIPKRISHCVRPVCRFALVDCAGIAPSKITTHFINDLPANINLVAVYSVNHLGPKLTNSRGHVEAVLLSQGSEVQN